MEEKKTGPDRLQELYYWDGGGKRINLKKRQCLNDSGEKQATFQVKCICQAATSFIEFHYLQNRVSFLSARPTPNLQVLCAKCRISFLHKDTAVDHTHTNSRRAILP
jgi:hypothetical protein